MNFIDYIEPVDCNKFNFSQRLKENTNAYFHIEKSINLNELSNYDIALFGIEEERNTPNKGTALAPDKIREQFYLLNKHGKARVADLGNLRTGKTLKDTYIAIRDVVFELLANNVVPIVFGGGQDLTYGIYQAYDKLDKPINLVSIDPRFDLGYKKDDFDSDSYLGQIILDKGKNLFNYTNLGYQVYYCTREELNLLNKLNFDAFSLGQIRSDMSNIEPVLRDANMVSVDVSAIKQSDAPAHKVPSPNGFYSEEICQLARYAGISDNVSTFGLFEMNAQFDANGQTAALLAQVIWYFIDGYNARRNDFPVDGTKEYTKHIVSFEQSDENLVFYQNNYNQRWWMLVPNPKKQGTNQIIACTYNDYKMACNNELPERWLKTLQKLN